MTRTTCVRRTLASGDVAVVEQCSCGAVHVTIGAITMRLPGSAIPPLGDILLEAAGALGHAPAHALPVTPRRGVLS
jgi:hypothetical protein